MKKFLLLCFSFVMAFAAMAQDRVVTGKVTSAEDSTPLPGVNVLVKGTATGTVTDVDGKFTISVPSTGSTLIFSFIGLRTMEIVAGERSVIDVQLVADVTQLSEVVVTALGLEVSKDRLGSATSKISGAAVKNSGEATLINGLSGKAAGVYINRTTGDPGAGSYIQIRGQSSINNSVQPLIVIDGVPVFNNGGGGTGGVAQQSRLNDINPNDVETMEVLKGASASALWGSRAANGVIMITTKKGSSAKGKINVSYSASYSQDRILRKHPMQRTWGQGVSGYYYTNALGDGLFGSGTGLPYSFGDKISTRSGGPDVLVSDPTNPQYVGYLLTPDGNKIYPVLTSDFDPTNTARGGVHGGKNSQQTYDQYDAIFQTGSYWDHNVSLSGGDKTGNFLLSIGDMNQKGIVKANSDYHRSTIRFNSEKVFNSIVKIGTNFNYSRIVSNRIQQGSNVNGLFLGALRTAPDYDNSVWKGTYVNASGLSFLNRQVSYRNQIGRRADPSYDNPVWVMNENLDKSEVDRFIGSTQIDISPLNWLTLTGRFGVDHFSDRRKTYFPVNTAGATNSGQLTLQTPRQTQLNIDFFGRGTWDVSKNLNATAIVGFNFNQRTSDNVGGTTRSFTIVNNPPLNLTNATSPNNDAFNAFSIQRVAALYSSIDLGYKDQLFVNLTGRSEAASTYGRAQSPVFFYPSANVAWQFTKTMGLENNILSFGKLRAGFGKVATQPQPYSTATYYNGAVYGEGWGSNVNSSAYVNGGYEEGSTLGNNTLKPEIKTEVEFGGDFRLLQNKINLGATYFTNKVEDILLPVALAPATGFTNQLKNAAAISNKGIELELSGDVFSKGGFTWNLYGNWSRIRNKVTSLSGTTSLFLAGFAGTSSRAVEGYPVGVLWGTDFLKDSEGKLIPDANGFPQASPTEQVLGNPNPDWRGGIGSMFSFKGFNLNVLVEHSHGGQIWGGTRGAMFNFGTHADTDHEVTLSAAEAATLKNYGGETIAAYGSATSFGYPYAPNPDGSYTIRGYVTEFVEGQKVVVDESYWTGLGGGFGAVSSHFIESAQWTRLREVTLSYSLNSEKFRKATKLSSIDFSVTGRNLYLWTDFKGNDPETNLTGPTNGRGLDYFNNPATKSVVFSVKINY